MCVEVLCVCVGVYLLCVCSSFILCVVSLKCACCTWLVTALLAPLPHALPLSLYTLFLSSSLPPPCPSLRCIKFISFLLSFHACPARNEKNSEKRLQLTCPVPRSPPHDLCPGQEAIKCFSRDTKAAAAAAAAKQQQQRGGAQNSGALLRANM